MKKPVVLIVFDGFGIAPPGPGNAITIANPPNISSYLYSYPNTTLQASGESVGLPPGEVGNTEVGHINIGAGRIVYQDLPRINMSIADGGFYKNKALLEGINHVKKTNGHLHLIGLVGEGSVHSNIDHLFALLYLAKEHQIRDVFIHAITDGRDSPPKAAEGTIQRLEEKILQLGVGSIASVMGRYYAMDRDQRWDRIEKAYVCLTEGIGNKAATAAEAIQKAYDEKKSDEFIDPTLIVKEGSELPIVKEGDTVIFFNFRIDRPRQLTKAFVLEPFDQHTVSQSSFDPYAVKYNKSHLHEQVTQPPFQRKLKINDLCFITMTEYEKNLPVSVAFPPNMVALPLGRVLSQNGIRQLRMSESEKERFVTFYFNGQTEQVFENEERTIIPSPQVATYDLKPEMSALEITDELTKQMRSNKYEFIFVNFANADMVGHTGNIEATVKAIKTLDACLANIVTTAFATDFVVCVTADHGNAEQKINPKTGGISTEHTGNPVPFLIIHPSFEGKITSMETGVLADIAPTILALMEIEKPATMSGRNLLQL